MPGNIVELNGKFRWYVGDSKMDEVITYLNEHGISIVYCPDCGTDMEPNVRARLTGDSDAIYAVCQSCGAELEIGGLFGV